MRAMFVRAAAAAALALSAVAGQAETRFGPLLSPQELVEARAAIDPAILDIRGDAYAAGHIPGALDAPYALFRGPKENPGLPPSDAALTEALRGLGLTLDRAVVVVPNGSDATDFGAAARVYWTLKSAGFERLAILNGGMTAWTEGNVRPVSTTPVSPVPSDITVTLSDRWLATQTEVLAIVEGKEAGRLVDARPAEFHAGEKAHPAAARPGTLPQSEYFTHSRWFSDGPAVLDAEAVRRIAAEQGFGPDDRLVSFCNTGHWAATNWFALSEVAGIEGVKLYAESMVGWSNAGLPMANVPGLLQNLVDQVKRSF